MLKHFKKTFILVLGVFFLLLGIVGLALPFLQGFLFLIIGFLLVSICVPGVREWSDVHTRKYPKVHVQILKIEDWLKRVVGDL